MFGKSLYGLLFFAVLSSCFFENPSAAARSVNQAVLTVKASPEATFYTQLEILNKKTIKIFAKEWPRTAVPAVPVSDTYLTLSRGGSGVTYVVDREGCLFHESNKERIEVRKDLRQELMKYVRIVRSRHYGDLVHWERADRLLPKKSVFKVIDLETGLVFRVQRRAGKSHADAQPLTLEDTAVMKRIYNGKWSWQRKAILVQAGDRIIAASMHGMPHGGDGIPDNGFRGHFCIHFLGSATHGSRKEDPGHQIMVRKAGGELPAYFDKMSPGELAEMFFIVLNLKEPNMARMLFSQADRRQLEYFLQDFEGIAEIHILSIDGPQHTEDLLAVDIPVEAAVVRKNRGEEKAVFTFHFRRMSFMEPWKMDSIMMIG